MGNILSQQGHQQEAIEVLEKARDLFKAEDITDKAEEVNQTIRRIFTEQVTTQLVEGAKGILNRLFRG